MTLLTHELHPSVVHLPIALLPSAAVMNAIAAGSGDPTLDRVGCGLWWSVSAAGLIAGLSGMAASQEVRAEQPRARRRLLLHGLGNAAILTTALGVTLWRSRSRASWVTAGLGLLATAAACVTGYLGGEMVYGDGIGVKAVAEGSPQGVGDSPPLFSSRGLAALLRDAGQGAAWLARNAAEAFRADESAGRAMLPER